MFHHHHANGVLHGPERSEGPWLIPCGGLFHCHDVREKDLLFLEHVWPQLVAQPLKQFTNMKQLGMVCTMRPDDLQGQLLESVHFISGENVMCADNVGGERRERKV